MRIQFAESQKAESGPRFPASQRRAVLGMVALFSAAALPFSPFVNSIGRGPDGTAEFAALEAGRQKVLTALGAAVTWPESSRDPATRSVNAPSGHGGPAEFLASLAPLVKGMDTPKIGLSSSPLFDSIAAAAFPTPPAPERSGPADTFRRIARFGLPDNVDFSPTASTNAAPAELLPPLARAMAGRQDRLKLVADAAGKRKAKAPAKAEFTAKAFEPHTLSLAPPSLQSVDLSAVASFGQIGGRAGAL
jgi:hypothetical protein